MLKVNNLNVFYGGIHALKGVSLNVSKGQIVSIIGSNGAGKSTLINSVSGIVKYKEIAGTLSGGEQQMLAMGRGLMSNPDLILLDEPSLGLAPLLINTIFDIIIEIKNMGKTILLVEQNAFKALSIADYAYVLEQGVITMEGNANELIKNEKIKEVYLGKKNVAFISI